MNPLMQDAAGKNAGKKRRPEKLRTDQIAPIPRAPVDRKRLETEKDDGKPKNRHT